MPHSPDNAAAQRFQQVQGLFARAKEMPASERTRWVQKAAADAAMASEVLALLAADAAAGGTDQLAAPARDALAADPAADSPAAEQVHATATGDLLQRLATSPKLDEQRFVVDGEVGAGGMGVVHRVHDGLLHRQLAMKMLRERTAPRTDEEKRRAQQQLGRFLEEAQVTSQLDHPGVVPVHELGLDQRGQVYFTMRLVKGRIASEVFADARAERNDWTTTRALEVVLRVVDTMAYAHAKGVLHRDLKPNNVMVGRFGEVYVMDWGLAKVLGQKDRHDLRIRMPHVGEASSLDTARRRDAEADAASSVVSMDGQRLGTPSYMPPEQARGEDLDVRADVYAIGAMMYELLTGRSPYRASDEKVEGYVVLERVKAGPPPRIEQLSKGVPAELVAIVDRAMARDRDQRYATVLELATDLRAFLSQRTVKAYRTGALVEMKMWMRRNRALARTLVIAVLLQTAGIIGTLVLYTWTEHHRTEASHARTELGGKVEEFDRLAQVLAFDRLVAEEPTLVPGWPDQLPAIQRWRADTASLLGKRDALGRTVAALQRQQATAGGAELATGTGFLAQALAGLLEKLPQLAALDAAMAQREAWAAMLGSAPAAHGGALFTWTAAREAIAKADGDMASTLYAGQRIELRDEDVHGLVPLGRDPTSKLWEFYDLRSAWDGASELARIAIPRRQADGSFLNSPDLGAILVLMPGGPLPDLTSTPDGPDPRRNVRLDPFFVGKYEVTRGQWLRWGGAIPPGPGAADPSARPVAQVSWKSATQLLRQHGLILPSELQWEYAARGGTSSTWWNGDDWNLARRVENLGSGRLLPVGSGQANPFGLFDVAGNVRELCSDEHTAYGTERPGDGRRPEPADSVARSCRGGSFAYEPDRGGSGHRNSYSAAYSHIDLGLRVVRPLRRGR